MEAFATAGDSDDGWRDGNAMAMTVTEMVGAIATAMEVAMATRWQQDGNDGDSNGRRNCHAAVMIM